MEASIRLGSIRGIKIGIHYTWFIVLIVFSYLLAEGQYPNQYEGWTTTQYWVVAVATVILLFASVLVHELGHSFVAQARGIEVVGITLFIFGGVAQIAEESDEPGGEFAIAIAGPITSLGLSAIFGGLWALLHETNAQVGALLGYLAVVNAILAVFNLIPGFPLDGGRVLRAILWKITGDIRRSTRIVSVIGSLVGSLFFVLGIFAALSGNLINGLWYLALGWFLQNAANMGYRQVEQHELIKGHVVSEVMDPAPLTVMGGLTVAELVHDWFLARNVRGAPVVTNDWFEGIVTISDVRHVPRDEWDQTLVRYIMTPRDQVESIAPDDGIDAALQLMSEHDFDQAPVLADDKLVGLLRRADLVRFIHLQQALAENAPRRSPAT